MLKAAETSYPPEAALYDLDKARLLVSICAELSRRANGGEIFLACRDAAQMIGTDHVTAAKFLRILVADGLLVQTTPGTSTTYNAPRYHYTGGCK